MMTIYLLCGYVNGLIENQPNGRLPAAGVRRAALVGHVAVGVWQQ